MVIFKRNYYVNPTKGRLLIIQIIRIIQLNPNTVDEELNSTTTTKTVSVLKLHANLTRTSLKIAYTL